MFIDLSLYMACRCLSLLGTPDLWIRLGWLQSSTRNGMKWGALTLLEISHSRGCYLKFAVLLVQRVCLPKRPNTKDPELCALEAYIAGDTLHHQPMGVGHVTVLQLCGPMGLRVLQWCHPMLACAKRTSYCTRIITLYGARKVDSGPRISHSQSTSYGPESCLYQTQTFVSPYSGIDT